MGGHKRPFFLLLVQDYVLAYIREEGLENDNFCLLSAACSVLYYAYI